MNFDNQWPCVLHVCDSEEQIWVEPLCKVLVGLIRRAAVTKTEVEVAAAWEMMFIKAACQCQYRIQTGF